MLGLLPKMAALVESVPPFVLGGAGIVMFGMVAATGIRILTGVDFKTNRYNLFVVAICGRLRHDPAGGAEFLRPVPAGAQAAARVRHPAGGDRARWLLNAFFNGVGSLAEARAAHTGTGKAAEHA